jgi:asparagine synthase (glutamine-hydrolysing)
LQPSTDDFNTALEKTDEFLHKAVRRRVESSDLEVGSFLSGGIDSGIVTAVAKKYNSTLKTFTVSFDGEYDEAPLAKLVADRYQTHHTEIKITFDNLVNDIEKILSNYGEPFFDSSAIPSYYVSREAKKYLTVILNGDGGDELFGGYRRYVPFARYDFFNPGFIVRNTAGIAKSILPIPHNKKSKYNFIYRLADLASKKGLDTYLSATIDSFEGLEKYLSAGQGLLNRVEEDFAVVNKSNLSGLQKLMNLDFDNILAGNLLVKMDIATMAHSLEGRSPLLSKELLEYIPSLRDQYKIKGQQTKHLLRTLAERYLPEPLINQPKRGFEIPLKKWIDNELREIIASYVLPANSYCRNFVKPGFIEGLWDRKIKTGDEKRAKMLWTLFALEVWYKKCYIK